MYFKNRPYNIPAFVDFAKLIRVLTIEETTAGISARLTHPKEGELYTRAVPWVDERPQENIIKLPKDFKL